MNWTKLFEAQDKLDKHIEKQKGLQGKDLLNKKILAFIAEFGELLNEWRGFKFWSEYQEPNTKEPITAWGEPYRNPMLEEYVDGLHFLLSIGLELGVSAKEVEETLIGRKVRDITVQFLSINTSLSELWLDKDTFNYCEIVNKFIRLGKMLGFTCDQIEQAYFEKNKINFERQANGY